MAEANGHEAASPGVGSRAGAALRRALEREFTTAVDAVAVGEWQVELLRPRNSDDLISEADFVRDERLPYWADLWPSARTLAPYLLERGVPADVPHPRLLELGCGLGLVTIAAMRAGWDVTATDYYADALRFTRANAWTAMRREPATHLLDWRALPAEIGSYERIVAADVLYEHAYAPLISSLLARALAPGGRSEAVIADPGRIAAPAFLEGLAADGLRVAATETRPFVEGTIRQQITLYTIRRAGS